MPQLAAQKIEEMADIGASRKRKIATLCSAVGLIVVITFSLVRLVQQEYFLAAANILLAATLALNVLYLVKHSNPTYGGLVLSAVLICHSVVLLFHDHAFTDRLLWFYPMTAVLIIANDFKVGAVLSSSLFVMVFSMLLYSGSLSYAPNDVFLVTLFTLTLLCNISAYHFSKIMSYLQSLYQEGIEDLAYLDHLTGLANRRSFESWASNKLEEAKKSEYLTAMVFLDIDNFKTINDTYGHHIGDRVLQHFAKRLRNNVRNKDRHNNKNDYSIARFAGDEFVLLLYDVKSQQDLDGILQRICHLFSHRYQAAERLNELTVSVGVAMFPADANTLSELTRCADKAMYAAKHRGKNQYCYYRMEKNNATSKSSEAKEKLTSITSRKHG